MCRSSSTLSHLHSTLSRSRRNHDTLPKDCDKAHRLLPCRMMKSIANGVRRLKIRNHLRHRGEGSMVDEQRDSYSMSWVEKDEKAVVMRYGQQQQQQQQQHSSYPVRRSLPRSGECDGRSKRTDELRRKRDTIVRVEEINSEKTKIGKGLCATARQGRKTPYMEYEYLLCGGVGVYLVLCMMFYL
ncbi:uncharacterized protein RCO7_15174 [Rhynchosporium graminicola]|uniref:Uncharacterized protein n=1 Tax=Rhynchosporium graminicola TaxID=2792576 RepID=A0A1E1LP09_9HELO|nr:uncharacterized protein RCO7_15174 [Rhynchosporium commune]